MSKKLSGNGLWESSRMMLPEHKVAYTGHQRNLQKKPRPQLDEQEMERISMILAESMQYGKEITIILFGEYENWQLTGVVTKIDQYRRMARIQNQEGWERISLDEILAVEEV